MPQRLTTPKGTNVMHTCRLVAGYAGCILAVVLATAEAIAVTSSTNVLPAIRDWAFSAILVAVIIACTLAVLELGKRILERLDQIAEAKRAERQAEADYNDIDRRIRPARGSNLHTLYPEE